MLLLKSFFSQLCHSSQVNLCCHKNPVDFNGNYRHGKVAGAGKQDFAPVFHLWTKVLPRTLSTGYFVDGETGSEVGRGKVL